MGKLDNKVAVITGAAGGIGRAAAKLFSEEGARLMLVDLDEANLSSMVEEIGSDKASYVAADVSNANDVKNYIDKTLSTFQKILRFPENPEFYQRYHPSYQTEL